LSNWEIEELGNLSWRQGRRSFASERKLSALRVIRLFRSLPYRTDTQVLGKQLLRCGTSVAANYRAVCRARSKAEFVARIGVAAEEADEAVLWIELLTESGIIKPELTQELLKEAKELAAILTASQRTAKRTV
jgi:four helix bundle protein